ncbi:unnamed protein product [Closterium sp. NIES-54]
MTTLPSPKACPSARPVCASVAAPSAGPQPALSVRTSAPRLSNIPNGAAIPARPAALPPPAHPRVSHVSFLLRTTPPEAHPLAEWLAWGGGEGRATSRGTAQSKSGSGSRPDSLPPTLGGLGITDPAATFEAPQKRPRHHRPGSGVQLRLPTMALLTQLGDALQPQIAGLLPLLLAFPTGTRSTCDPPYPSRRSRSNPSIGRHPHSHPASGGRRLGDYSVHTSGGAELKAAMAIRHPDTGVVWICDITVVTDLAISTQDPMASCGMGWAVRLAARAKEHEDRHRSDWPVWLSTPTVTAPPGSSSTSAIARSLRLRPKPPHAKRY